LSQFAYKEGYPQDKIEFYQSAAELKNFNLLQKGVSRLLLNSSDLTSVIKSFHSWKEFTLKRKRIKTATQHMINFMKKSDIVKAFSVWKKISAATQQREALSSKRALQQRYFSRYLTKL